MLRFFADEQLKQRNAELEALNAKLQLLLDVKELECDALAVANVTIRKQLDELLALQEHRLRAMKADHEAISKEL